MPVRVAGLTARPDAQLFAGVFALALGLRLLFSLVVSRIPVIWDAAAYWADAQRVRTSMCSTFGYCRAGAGAHAGIHQTIDLVAFSKDGVLPLLQGSLLTLIPNTPTSALVVFAAFDALGCVLISSIALRLGAPRWVAGLGGVIGAVYVPGIIGDGSILQQPLIRVAIVAAVWSYVAALTSDSKRNAFVVAGTCSCVVLGFASESTRPLMWVLPLSVIFVARRSAATRSVAGRQFRALAVLAVTLIGAATLIDATFSSHTFAAAVSSLMLGLSPSGTAAGQVTVLSFQHFWPSDAWTYFRGTNATTSVFNDFVHAPSTFARLWAFSVYSNWQYPDFLYFQKFGIGLRGQRIEHLAFVLTGVAGLAWLTGQAGPRRLAGVITLSAATMVSLIAGVVDVESRRVGSLIPLLGLGAACFAWSLVRLRPAGRSAVIGATIGAACTVSWLIDLPQLLEVARVSPTSAHWLLELARLFTSAALGRWILVEWRRSWDGFELGVPAIVGSALILLIVTSQLSTIEWRGWSTTIRSPIRQKITGLRVGSQSMPWLIADFAKPSDAAASTIFLNGRVVKRAGVPMGRWQIDAGLIGWSPYETLEQISGRRPHTWMALALPRGSIASRVIIEVQPPRRGVTLAGDFSAARSNQFVGPALTPAPAGLSLWRWLWNGADPRITASQILTGRYTSMRQLHQGWSADDLSTAGGRVNGLYRIFVVQEPFGKSTNVLQAPSGERVAVAARCPTGTPLRGGSRADGDPFACVEPDGTARYYAEGGRYIGRTTAAQFSRNTPRSEVVDQGRSGESAVRVVHIAGPLYLANIYRNGRLVYSLGFSYPASPPTYL